MIHVILGHSASGKTSVQKKLASKNVPMIVPYTTRSMREKEIQNVDYHFVSVEEFKQLINVGEMQEYQVFNDWYYGTSLKGYDYKNTDYTLMCSPATYRTLKDKIGQEFITSYYIKLHERERIIRRCKRKDNVDEIIRRIYTDREDFRYVSNEVDYTFTNPSSKEIAEKMYEIIKKVR